MRKNFELSNFLIRQIVNGQKCELRVPVYDNQGEVVSAKIGGGIRVTASEYGRSVPFNVGDSVVISKKITIRIEAMTMDLLNKISEKEAISEGAYPVGEGNLRRYEFNGGKVSHMTAKDAVVSGLHEIYGIEAGSPVVVYKFKLIMSPVPSAQ